MIERIYTYNSCYHHRIGSINIFHCCHVFPWLCARRGCTIICCHFHIYPGRAGFCVFYYCAVLLCAQIIECIMARWSYSFIGTAHYLFIIITIIIIHILRYWSSKMLVRYSVCLRLSQLSQSIIFHTTYGTVLIQLTHFSNGDCENTCTSSFIIIKSEVWPIYHCLGLGYETMVCAVFRSIFLWFWQLWIWG